MADHPPPPEDVLRRASAAATAASQSADAAQESANTANTAAQTAQTHSDDAKKAATTTKTERRLRITIPIIEVVVSIAVFVILAIQASQIREQVAIATGAAKTSNEAVDLTKRQLQMATATYRYDVIRDLKIDADRIRELLYNSANVFEAVRITNCVPPPELSNKDKRDIHLVFSHYELYYEAANLELITGKQWRTACLDAEDQFEQNCLLRKQWEDVYVNRVSSGFKKSFVPGCNLSKIAREE